MISFKHKRVGFSDPLSSTKEYLKEDYEIRKKQLVFDDDEDNEENKENENEIEPVEIPPGGVPYVKAEIQEEVEQLMNDHNYIDNSQPQSTVVTTSDNSETPIINSELVFKDKNELLDYIAVNFSIDEVFDKISKAEQESQKQKQLMSKIAKTFSFADIFKEYFPSNGSPGSQKQISTLITELKNLTKTNQAAKYKFLAAMSTQHSEDFLEVALQANSISAVCDAISTGNVVKYLIRKINIDDSNETKNSVNNLNRVMVKHLIANTVDNEFDLDQKEIHEMMNLLFQNKTKIDTFDIAQEYLRNIIQKNEN